MYLHALLLAALTAWSIHVSATDLLIGSLPNEKCVDEFDLDTGIYKDPGNLKYKNGEAISLSNTKYSCIFSFLPNGAAQIQLNGKILQLKMQSKRSTKGLKNSEYPSVGREEYYLFVANQNSIKITLQARVISSSCHAKTESCCGDNYAGILSVDRNEKQTQIPVVFYRGG